MNIKNLIIVLFIVISLPLGGIASPAVSTLTTDSFINNLKEDIILTYKAKPEDILIRWEDEPLEKKIGEIKKLYPGKEISVKVKDFILQTISGKVSLPADLFIDGKLNRILYIKCKVEVLKEVLVASANIKKDEDLTENNVKYVRIPVNKIHGRTNTIIGLEEIKGKIAVSEIKEDSVITSQLIKQKTVIFRGNQVTIRIINGGLTLTGVGQAMQDGYLGQNITVKITSFSTQKIILAKVLDYNLVEVDLGSDNEKK